MRNDDLSSLREGLGLQGAILTKEAEQAFLTRGIANRDTIYPAEYEAVTSAHKITALFGANQCIRAESEVLMADGTTTPICLIKRGDMVTAYDFTTKCFVPSPVIAVYENLPMIVHRFQHDFGTLECTASHKVCTATRPVLYGQPHGNIYHRLRRVIGVSKFGIPVVVRNEQGVPTISNIVYDGRILTEITYDITIAHRDHAFVCNNVVVANSGKTLSMAHRAAWDTTGLYPDWYPGPRTSRGIDAWVIGDTGMNVRDSYQRKLFGPDPNRPGWTDRPGEEALISAKYLASPPNKQGQPAGLFDTVRIKHVPSETTSTLTFKSHQMDTQSLASWTGDRVFIDEECPLGILNEMLARMLRRNGQIFISLCPLGKYPDMVSFLLTAPMDLVRIIKLGHDQVKHLSEGDKLAFARMFSSNPAELAARTRGDYVTNTGLIFPFPAKDIIYDPAKVHIPTSALYLGGMDVGFTHPTAAVALALDKMTDTAYCYASYAQAQKPYVYHHSMLLRWGDNMTFMVDPASDQGSQAEGVSILHRYWELAHPGRDDYDGEIHYKWEQIPENKRKYIKANRAFMPTMDDLWHRYETGRMRINANLTELLTQYGNYTWNKDGTGARVETPAVPLDIITALRYGSFHLSEYAHRLDRNPPWMDDQAMEGWADPIPDWSPFKAGRE